MCRRRTISNARLASGRGGRGGGATANARVLKLGQTSTLHFHVEFTRPMTTHNTRARRQHCLSRAQPCPCLTRVVGSLSETVHTGLGGSTQAAPACGCVLKPRQQSTLTFCVEPTRPEASKSAAHSVGICTCGRHMRHRPACMKKGRGAGLWAACGERDGSNMQEHAWTRQKVLVRSG